MFDKLEQVSGKEGPLDLRTLVHLQRISIVLDLVKGGVLTERRWNISCNLDMLAGI